MDSLNLCLAVIGCCTYSTALHFKQPGKNIENKGIWGLAQNLTVTGRVIFHVGALLALLSIIV